MLYMHSKNKSMNAYLVVMHILCQGDIFICCTEKMSQKIVVLIFLSYLCIGFNQVQ